MKKKANQNKENASKKSGQEIDKLKYEVGQEMGIKPKTKNKKS